MRVLITGAEGFVGSHLIKLLLERGHEVFAGVHKSTSTVDGVENVTCDILNRERLEMVMQELKPAGVIHLAAQSKVIVAWEEPADTVLINTIGSINLVQAATGVVPGVKVLTIGSSEEYGLAARQGEQLTEEAACLPQNPYSSSKLAMGQIILQLARRDSLNIMHVRPFNHFGPGQQEDYVMSDFAAQVARIEKGLIEPVIRVGDLSTRRDFTAVRDVVRAYALLLEGDLESGVYNICSGIPREIKAILNFMVSRARVAVQVEVDAERFRPSEVPVFVGSAKKIKNLTGWQPELDFEEAVVETMDWWREQV